MISLADDSKRHRSLSCALVSCLCLTYFTFTQAQDSVGSGASVMAESKLLGPPNGFDVSGDFRLRYESNSSNGPTPAWDRGVLRARLAAGFKPSDSIKLGARLVTGDLGNPRSSDTSISNFANDLEVSLDQVYVSYQNQSLFLTGGKFAKPFSSTELVWDGDVNPQGMGGHIDFLETDTWSSRISGIYFLIDENNLGGDSNMLGAQLSASLRQMDDWSLSVHASYFDYELGPLGPSAASNARGNNLAPDGATYLSDFELFNISSSVRYTGIDDRWPVKFVWDYVRNLGAAVPADTGYGFDLFVGRLNRPGDLQLRYGYSQAETDAVLGLFSNDNIVYPTNYKLHSFSADYALSQHSRVGLTHYQYGRLTLDPASPLDDNWASRTRLNLYFVF